ncbi:G protein-coupled glucose receptor regulating Gpa2-domain-containing protein [Massariosphaeria phaeospora]|uniref:G protein-coupled glucose receptor regulating Gpa2-domain-containing protein n=1 Tax=Massariosphaeria phaeospora TaxID=100035 RepID=A0A7C8I369_9PLEO|nr:G protein-coupled glucose receptor regulating Gpa2-domain-containing protein [Massariosphaeria phaeospora]
MELNKHLSSRVVLSAPSDHSKIRTLSEVIVAVSVLSIVGAGWIIVSFCMFKQVRTFRHQLILGLAISDFWMAVNFLSSCAMNLSGHTIGDPRQQKFCSFNGFMTQLFVVQTDYWVLVIAICTFLILANYKHMSTWIQEHRVVLWLLPWGLSSLWAAIGLASAGYGNIGAWCWFTSDKVRLLVNFIPRWLIIIVILVLYARLYRLIYTAHNRFMSFNDDTSPQGLQPDTLEPETGSVSSTHRIGHPTISLQMESKDTEAGLEQTDGTIHGRTHARQPSPLLKKMARQMMAYPLVYMLIWTIPTSIRIYQSVTGKPAPFGIATVDKACIVIQGFADAVIYGINETSVAAWRESFRKSPPTAPAPALPSISVNVRHDIRVERTLRSESLDEIL